MIDIKDAKKMADSLEEKITKLKLELELLPFYSFKKKKLIMQQIKTSNDFIYSIYRCSLYDSFSELPINLKILLVGLEYMLRKL
jgi:hypothetical protein